MNRHPSPVTGDAALSDDALALARFVRLLIAGKWVIITSILLTALLAVVAAWTMTPVYRAQAVLAFVSDDSDAAGINLGALNQIAGFAGLSGLKLEQPGSSRDEALAILTSRDLTAEFIVANELLPRLFAAQFDAEGGNWVDIAPTIGEAVKEFDEEIRSLYVEPATGLIRLSIEWPDRALAASWVNGLVAYANERIRQSAITEARRSIDYLQEELGKTSVAELRQAIYRLIEVNLHKIMLANVRYEYAFKVLDPAVKAEKSDYIRPKRLLMLGVGILLGGFIGVFLVIVRQAFRQLRASGA